MTWDEKLRVLTEAKGIDQDFLACNFTVFPPNRSAVNVLKHNKAWLPSAYQQFLETTNGAQLGTFVFFGVDGDTITTLQAESELWGSAYSSHQWLPIGKDSAGNPFLLRRDGAIDLGSIDDPGMTIPLAHDFENLLNSVILGEGYMAFMGGNVIDDDWYEFLTQQKWANQ